MLTPSERIAAIREIASRLSREDWGLIDLTLSQFGLPWSDNWVGDEYSYITKMISEASAESLGQLAAHLGYDLGHERPAVEPDFWKPACFRLFASHIAKDKGLAADLQASLSGLHVSMFVAHADISPTREWQDEIELALSTTDALVALLTPGFHESYWTDQEVGFVLGRGRLAVAIRLGEEPYGFMGKLQAFPGEGRSPKDLARSMVDAFLTNKATKKQMTLAVMSGFENSGGWEQAKTNMSLLEHSDYWESQFEERITRAVQQNSEVRDAFGVPDRARKVIEKWKEAV